MNDLSQHCRYLLGLNTSWNGYDVEFDRTGSEVVIYLSFADLKLSRPECGVMSPHADTGPRRSWRRVNKIRITTEIRAAVPRCRCEKCGVLTIQLPRNGKQSRYKRLFEAFAIRLLEASLTSRRRLSCSGFLATRRINSGIRCRKRASAMRCRAGAERWLGSTFTEASSACCRNGTT